ncbi:hypothetical protein HQ563_05280 [bacterium]|nr:hypothetical protein [bacterium]
MVIVYNPAVAGYSPRTNLFVRGANSVNWHFPSLRGEVLRLAAVLLLDGEEWKPMGKRTCRKSAAHFWLKEKHR